MWKKQHIVVSLLVYINVSVFCEYLSISEGDSCSWKGMTGTCAQLHRCLSAKESIKQVSRPPALLGYGSEWITAQWLCGGTLISTNFVLTAGHCISSPVYGPVTYIGLGLLKRSDEPGKWWRYRVKRIIPHPDYHPPSKYNDIALLETGAPILFPNDLVLPACLTKGKFEYPGYNEATGWGKLGHRRELADTMQYVDLLEFSEEECMREYPPHRHLLNGYNHTTQMCFGRRDEIVDTCEGDSGGPLHQGKASDYVIGVTSYGRACGISSGAGIYTRVSFYLPWIESIVWPDI